MRFVGVISHLTSSYSGSKTFTKSYLPCLNIVAFKQLRSFPQSLASVMVSQPKTPPPYGYQDVSGGLLATTILVTVLCIVIVALRFATRIWIVKRVGWDDWCILFACVSGRPVDGSKQVAELASSDILLGWH